MNKKSIINFVNTILYINIGLISSVSLAFADGGILGNFKGDPGSTEKALRSGDIHTDDIPNIIRGVIDFMMGIAGTIAIIFIIVGSYKILLGSIQQDKSEGKNTIIMAITGFAIASLAWFIIKFIIDNFS
ncbi:MAG: pilin [Candidatus Gracilibacteria bacterium]|nr:pilin [Candidatus Gracilibacteria bacterium]